MKYRRRVGRRKSRRDFSRKASRTNYRNMADARIMRGGYRM